MALTGIGQGAYMRGRVGLALLVVMLGAGADVSRADQDYNDHDFSVRLPPAFVRFTDVSAFGGGTAANRWSSAINPASAGWARIPNEHGTVIAPYYSNVCFTGGMNLHIVGESVTWDSRKWGVFQPTIGQIRNSDGRTNQGMDFDYHVDTVQLQWAKRWDDWAAGACFNFAKAEVHQDGTVVTPGPIPSTTDVSAEGNAESYRFRFGALKKFGDKLLTGVVFEYGVHPTRDRTTRVTTVPLPVPPTITVTHRKDTQQQYVLRPAVSWEYMDMSTISVDYQFGAFFNEVDCLRSHRWSISAQHRILDPLFLRGGISIDHRGNVGGSTGFSLYLTEWAGVFLGYQYNMLPELAPEFGRAHTFQAGLSIRF